MIYCDVSEVRQGSKLPDIAGIVPYQGFEESTGADIMVSPISLPCTTGTLIRKHLDMGAVLIQRKSGNDLLASIPTRLEQSIGRLQEIVVYPYQAMLLFCGRMESSPAGYAIINGDISGMSYMAVIGALSSWQLRGGTYLNLDSDDLLPEFLREMEARVIDYSTHPFKKSYPMQPYQTVKNIKDWRITLATFPMIGEARAEKVRQELVRFKLGDDLFQALRVLTDGSLISPNGAGRTVTAACREWLGVPEGWNIDLVPIEKGDEK